MATFTDSEIQRFLAERKTLSSDFRARLIPKSKRGHSEKELAVRGEIGSQFTLLLRQSLFNPIDFSVIIAVQPPGTNRLFRLRRYNGRHFHTNRIEKETFDDFHIHQATQRYQDFGGKEDEYAERTDRYSDINGALGCALADCNCEQTNQAQTEFLF